MVVLQFHVSSETMREIRLEAERTGKSLSEVARKHLEKGMQEQIREFEKLKAVGKMGAIATAFLISMFMIVLSWNLFYA